MTEMSGPEPITDEDIIVEKVVDERLPCKPNRTRRAVFIFGSWLLSYALVVYLSLLPEQSKLAELAVDGCTTYMVVVMITYLTSTSIDRANMVSRVLDMVEKKRG